MPTTPPLVSQPTNFPTNKVLAGGIAGAVVTVAVFVVQQYDPGFTVPEPVIAAATTIVTFACAWLVRNPAVEGDIPGGVPTT